MVTDTAAVVRDLEVFAQVDTSAVVPGEEDGCRDHGGS
jgi:hypothetical protein